MQEITEEENVKIMRKCPRFQFCNAPKCPLDYFRKERVELAGDDKCKAPKSIRKKIGKGTKLQYQGMTPREWAGMIVWKGKSNEEKERIIERGRKQLAIRHHNAK